MSDTIIKHAEVQKFSDNSSIVGCITDNKEEEYRELVENFVGWCDRNHLQLNTGKTKEQVVDFRCRNSPPNTSFHKRGGSRDGGHLQVPWGASTGQTTLRPSTGKDRAGCSS